MLSRNTVFVVGAGCSYEYGLPLGDDLRDRIFKLVHAEIDNQSYLIADALVRSGVPEANHNVMQRLRTFARGIHTQPSIDQYLNFHQADPVHVLTGKLAIASCILNAERASKLTEPYLAPIQQTWLPRLFEAMNHGVTLENVESIFNNATFICFNYDRCIEHFMHRAVSALTGFDQEAVRLALRNLNIIHVYGSVAPLPWQDFDEFALPYGADPASYELVRSARNLRTFTESVDSASSQSIKAAITTAERICFLGFSYLEPNVELLRITPGTWCVNELYLNMLGMPPQDEVPAHNLVFSALAYGRPEVPQAERTHFTAAEFMWHYRNTLRR